MQIRLPRNQSVNDTYTEVKKRLNGSAKNGMRISSVVDGEFINIEAEAL